MVPIQLEAIGDSGTIVFRIDSPVDVTIEAFDRAVGRLRLDGLLA